MAKIGHEAKDIAFVKLPVWVKKLKCQKRTRKESGSTLELLCAKIRSKRHLIFQK